MNKKKNMGVNFIFYAMKTLMGVIFPLITFPYASRVLGPESLGKIDYAQANVTYFSLIAAFGISSYAVREGARLRDDKKKLSDFVGEMLAVNLVTVLIAYVLCFVVLLFPKFQNYRGLMMIFSSTIILTAFGLEWLYNIFEDYQYITIRSFIFQIISIILLYTCVKKENDYVIYAFILVLSGVGSNIMNLLRSRKYIQIKVTFNNHFFQHVKPMFYLFIMFVASSIYLVMDRSMLGFITGNDTEVGLYSAALKIIALLTSLMNTVRVVMTPRAAYYMDKDMEQVKKLNDMALKLVCLFSIPSCIGMFALSKDALIFFAGDKYTGATLALQILLLDFVFAALNGVIINQILIVQRKDKIATCAVAIGAIVNLIFNSVMIVKFGKEGAAVSTCISELSIFIFANTKAKEHIHIGVIGKQFIQSVIASIPIVGVYLILDYYKMSVLLTMVVTIAVGAALYFIVLIILKNELVMEGLKIVKKRLRKKGA